MARVREELGRDASRVLLLSQHHPVDPGAELYGSHPLAARQAERLVVELGMKTPEEQQGEHSTEDWKGQKTPDPPGEAGAGWLA